MSLTKMLLTEPFFNGRKWYVPAPYAAEWKPGPCVVWEITGECRNGDECICAHLDREALNKKNHANELGNYVKRTLKARCRYVLNQIKSGAWSSMKGQVREEAQCLVELLEWLPKQEGGEIDVDVVQSFIAANKIVANVAAEEQRLEALAVWEKFLADCISLQTENAKLEQQLCYEEQRLTEVLAQIKAAEEAAEAARIAAVKERVAALLKSGADSASVDKVATKAPVEPAVETYAAAAKRGLISAIVKQVAKEAPVAPAVNSYVAPVKRDDVKPANVDEVATEAPVAPAEERRRKEYQRLKALTTKDLLSYAEVLLTQDFNYANDKLWGDICEGDE